MVTKSAKIKRFNQIKKELKEMQLSTREKAILSLVLSTYSNDFEFSGNDIEFKQHIARHFGKVKTALENY